MDRDVKIIMMPGSNYNEHLGVQYNCFGGIQMISPQTPESQNLTGDRNYFNSPRFESSIKNLARHMEQVKTIHWSHVYIYLHKYMKLEEMSASAFGRFIQEHGGPNEQKVRKDGNYQPSSRELLRDKAVIESVSAFFPVD